jgi:hypothetical protein
VSDIVHRLRSYLTENGSVLVPGEVLADAANTIERLRALVGKADIGPSFREIAKDLPRNEPPNPS